jgi:hypothetical protein
MTGAGGVGVPLPFPDGENEVKKDVCKCGWEADPPCCYWHALFHCPECFRRIVRAAQTATVCADPTRYPAGYTEGA